MRPLVDSAGLTDEFKLSAVSGAIVSEDVFVPLVFDICTSLIVPDVLEERASEFKLDCPSKLLFKRLRARPFSSTSWLDSLIEFKSTFPPTE